MNLGHVFAHAVARRIAHVLVALLLAAIGTGRADAQPLDHHASSQATWAHCYAQSYSTCAAPYTGPVQTRCLVAGASDIWIYEQITCKNGTVEMGFQTMAIHQNDNYATDPTQCPSGQVRKKPTGECVDPAELCLSKNADVPSKNTAPYTGQQCIDGCVYGARPHKTGEVNYGSTAILYGEMGYTGETCTTPTPNPLNPNEERPETCTPAGGGMTMCIKDDGRHCYSASGPGAIDTSRQICWTPGETGNKTDGPVAQTRGPGTATPPAPTPPPGETFNPGTGPTTSTTTTPGGTTSTTTTINNTTINGTDAGDGDDGEPTGGDDEDEGSASGGEGCESPPACSGDAVGCATLVQVWRTRCSPNKNKITGGAECDSNGNPLFTCAGDEVMCKQALLQAEQVCRARKGDANGDGQPDWTVPGPGDGTEGAGPDPTDIGVKSVPGPGMGMLDTSGFLGGATCPTFGVLDLGEYGTFDLDEGGKLCDFTQIVKITLLLLGSFFAFQIIAGGRD